MIYKRGGFYHYQFQINGKRYRGSTMSTNKAEAFAAMRRHKELCKRLGFDFRLYHFRHTYGSRTAMAGVDLMTLKELMGQSSITLTQRYCHPTPEHKRRAIEKLEGFNAGQQRVRNAAGPISERASTASPCNCSGDM